MDARTESDRIAKKNRTTVERRSERELVITRTFNGPARLVFEAWTKPELLKRWWAPKSTGMTLLSCEADVRVGGTYRFVFGHGASEPMAFYGSYLEVTPHARLVWTNEEGGDGGEAGDPPCQLERPLGEGRSREHLVDHAEAIRLVDVDRVGRREAR